MINDPDRELEKLTEKQKKTLDIAYRKYEAQLESLSYSLVYMTHLVLNISQTAFWEEEEFTEVKNITEKISRHINEEKDLFYMIKEYVETHEKHQI